MNSEQIYYCSNCEYKIPTDLECKAHYRSDFHRYNIKRKLLNLSAVTFEVFQKSIQNILKIKKEFLESASNTSCSSSQQQQYSCKACNKTFYSNGTYYQHMNSQKHKSNLRQQEREKKKLLSLTSSSSEYEMIGTEECLFCLVKFSGLQAQLDHMKKEHGFFIREIEQVIDLRGLLIALNNIITKDLGCLHCYQEFKSVQAVRQHMIDKGHCFMPQEEYRSLSKYYDFSEKLNQMIDSKIDEEAEDYSSEDEWEWDSNESDTQIINSDEKEKEKKQNLRMLLKKVRRQRAKLLPNGELQLPNGKILGHRQYKKYYKQYRVRFVAPENMLEAPETDSEQEEIDEENKDNFQIVFGGQICQLFQVAVNKFDSRKQGQHYSNIKGGQLKIGLKNNKILMEHYRKSTP